MNSLHRANFNATRRELCKVFRTTWSQQNVLKQWTYIPRDKLPRPPYGNLSQLEIRRQHDCVAFANNQGRRPILGKNLSPGCSVFAVQVGGTKTLAHLAFGNDANRIEVRYGVQWGGYHVKSIRSGPSASDASSDYYPVDYLDLVCSNRRTGWGGIASRFCLYRIIFCLVPQV